MVTWAGGIITKGKLHVWTNWHINDKSVAFVEDYTIPEDWLNDIFDNAYSGELMPMPVETWN